MISQKQIDEVAEAIVRYYRPDRVILFGSYAAGTAGEDSDLDLAVIKSTTSPSHKRGAEVRKAIRQNGQVYYFSKDILVFTPKELEQWKEDPYSIVYEILKNGKTLYERPKPARLAH